VQFLQATARAFAYNTPQPAMTSPSDATPIVRFGVFELDLKTGELRRKVDSSTVSRRHAMIRVSGTTVRIDLIVGVQLCPLPRTLLGEARIVTATPDVRHVRIRIKIPNATDALISVLGHELQHATALAAARKVRDAEAQARLYRRIGDERHSGGYFETEAALDIGRVVAAEIGHAPLK
jgi:hypothetical protein